MRPLRCWRRHTRSRSTDCRARRGAVGAHLPPAPHPCRIQTAGSRSPPAPVRPRPAPARRFPPRSGLRGRRHNARGPGPGTGPAESAATCRSAPCRAAPPCRGHTPPRRRPRRSAPRRRLEPPVPPRRPPIRCGHGRDPTAGMPHRPGPAGSNPTCNARRRSAAVHPRGGRYRGSSRLGLLDGKRGCGAGCYPVHPGTAAGTFGSPGSAATSSSRRPLASTPRMSTVAISTASSPTISASTPPTP